MGESGSCFFLPSLVFSGKGSEVSCTIRDSVMFTVYAMKRIGLLFAAILLLPAGASAQGLLQRADFGVKVGLTSGTIRGDSVATVGRARGIAGGVYYSVPLSPIISFQPELLYIQKGYTYVDTEGNETEVTLGYIEVPLLLMFTIPSRGRVHSNLYAGPYVAFGFQSSTDDEDDFLAVLAAFNNTDFGITFGGNIGFMFSGKELTIGARYDLGLADVSRSRRSDVKTGTLALLVGITF